jgi:hypothetical protein
MLKLLHLPGYDFNERKKKFFSNFEQNIKNRLTLARIEDWL